MTAITLGPKKCARCHQYTARPGLSRCDACREVLQRKRAEAQARKALPPKRKRRTSPKPRPYTPALMPAYTGTTRRRYTPLEPRRAVQVWREQGFPVSEFHEIQHGTRKRRDWGAWRNRMAEAPANTHTATAFYSEADALAAMNYARNSTTWLKPVQIIPIPAPRPLWLAVFYRLD